MSGSFLSIFYFDSILSTAEAYRTSHERVCTCANPAAALPLSWMAAHLHSSPLDWIVSKNIRHSGCLNSPQPPF